MASRKNGLLLKSLTAITFIVMVAVNALANILPINGISTGEVSDSYPNLFAPAGLTFSIWGLIYLLLAAHTLYQFGLFHGKNQVISNMQLRKTAIVFSLSSLINTAWIFSWHYKIIALSMILMVSLLLCLIVIVTIINMKELPLREQLLVRLPFSIYFGWITVATIANATTLLVSIGWYGFGLPESTWTVIIIGVGTLIGTATTIRLKDIAYGLVLIWAYTGILIKHISASGFSKQYPDVIITVIICIILFFITNIYTLFTGKRNKIAQ